MRRLPLLGLAAVVLALAGGAGAKGPLPVRISGASGSVPLSGAAQSVSAIRVAEPGMGPYSRPLPARATTALRQAAARVEPHRASSTWPSETAAAAGLARSPAPAPMLGISFRSVGGALAWFDPLTLTALPGRKAPLAKHNGGGWAFSADRSIVALAGWEAAELRFVNARTMRVLGDLRLARGGQGVATLAWVRPDRLLAIVYDQPSALLVVVDPQRRRVVRRVLLPGAVFGTVRVPGGVALLIGSYEEFAPARVVFADADGNLRETVVSRVRVGTVVDQDSGDYRARTMSPGFAVDPVGRRAFLVAPDSTVAEVDLERLTVAYHQLDRPSLFGRLARWLVPAAQAKEVEGPMRDARWIGDGLIAVSGSDYSLTKGADGNEHQLAKAAGLAIVDTSSWRSRVLQPEASDFMLAGGLVLAGGGTYESSENGAEPGGIGLVAYGLDGRERWRLHPGERRWLSPAAGLGYVYLDEKHLEVVDVATGRVLKTITRDGEPWPVLLAAADSMS